MNKNTLIGILVLVIVVGGLVAFSGEREDKDGGEKMEVAAVPDTAYGGPEIPQDKGYLVEEVRDGLYYITEGIYHVMFLTTGQGVIVVDAPPSIGDNIIRAIAEVTEEPITHVIYSHSHADHISAAGIYPPEATYIAHVDTAAKLARNAADRAFDYGLFVGGGPVPTPTITFTDTYTLKVGSQTLELSYKGSNHEPGNIFVYAPAQKVLMLVDVVFPGWSPFKDLAIAEDIAGFIRAHDDILEFDFDTYIGGHLARLGDRADVEMQKEYILDMQNNAAAALQTVDFMAIAGEVGYANPWNLFNTYLDAVAAVCTEQTLVKWQDKLGGADIFTPSHCFRLAENLRVN